MELIGEGGMVRRDRHTEREKRHCILFLDGEATNTKRERARERERERERETTQGFLQFIIALHVLRVDLAPRGFQPWRA